MRWLRRLPEAPVTTVLIAANLLVYAVMAIGSGELLHFSSVTLIEAGAIRAEPGLVTTHWRWLTAAFIHVHLLHIVMNLWFLAQLGVLSERALGRGIVAASYVVTGVSGNALSAAIAGVRHSLVLSAGASGAIMGLIGVALAFAWRTGQKEIPRTLAFSVLFVLVLGFALTAPGVVAV